MSEMDTTFAVFTPTAEQWARAQALIAVTSGMMSVSDEYVERRVGELAELILTGHFRREPRPEDVTVRCPVCFRTSRVSKVSHKIIRHNIAGSQECSGSGYRVDLDED